MLVDQCNHNNNIFNIIIVVIIIIFLYIFAYSCGKKHLRQNPEALRTIKILVLLIPVNFIEILQDAGDLSSKYFLHKWNYNTNALVSCYIISSWSFDFVFVSLQLPLTLIFL